MFFFEAETGLVMIEIFHALHLVKGFFIMALPAILSKLVIMHINMATGAAFKRDPGKFLYLFAVNIINFVAFDTIHRQVLSCQFKFCFIMIKCRSGLK